MSMGVKSDKTFEEIVERLAALFKLAPRPGDRDYEETVPPEPVAEHHPATKKPGDSRTDKEK